MLQKIQNRFERLKALPRSAVGPIGLDFAQESLHMVQLRRNIAGDFSLLSEVEVPYPAGRDALLKQPAQIRSLLNKAYNRGRFKGRKVVAALPPTELRLSSVNYRASKDLSDGEIILRILQQRTDSDLSDQVIDFIPVRSRGSGDERLAVVAMAKTEGVVDFLEHISGAGLKVQALEINPLAINRLIVAMNDSADLSNALAINFGQRNSFLSVISGRRLLSDQVLDFGEHSLLAEFSRTLDMDEAKVSQWVKRYGLGDPDIVDPTRQEIYRVLAEVARRELKPLAEEIRRSEIYIASETHGERVNKVYVMGGIARWKGIGNVLSQLVDVPVTVLDPRQLDRHFGATDDPRTDAAVATGLALRGLAHA